MASLNKVQLIGNLCKDVELKYLPSGDAVTSNSIAINSSWKDKTTGEKKEAVEFVSVDFFGKLAEIVGQYLTKGASVYVEGRLNTRKYTDKDGVEKYITSVKVDNMQMLGKKETDGAAPEVTTTAPKKQSKVNAYPATDDDTPF